MRCLYFRMSVQGYFTGVREVKMTNTLFINGKECEYTNEPNLLEVIRNNGFNVPTFCYRPDLTQYGACRMCVVEIEGRGIQSSCTMPPAYGLAPFRALPQYGIALWRRVGKSVAGL